MIGRGAHGVVSMDADGLVRKRLHASMGEAAACVEREFTYLQRLSAALEDQPFLACPTPLAANGSERTLVMTHCRGRPLDSFLDDDEAPFEPHVAHIGEQIANAVDVYVRTFDEPYVSLSPANLLFDVGTRTLTLLDFTKPRTFPGIDTHQFALEVSLGCFVARAVHHTVGPRSTWRRRLLERNAHLVSEVLRHAPAGLATTVIVQVAMCVRGALLEPTPLDARHGPSWLVRQSWQRSVGAALFASRVPALVNRGRSSPTP